VAGASVSTKGGPLFLLTLQKKKQIPISRPKKGAPPPPPRTSGYTTQVRSEEKHT